MAMNIDQIAERLGAKRVAPVAHAGGGPFGAARLGKIIAAVQARLAPGQGRRAGRPSDASWIKHPKVPMSQATERRLSRLAERASASGRKVSPMQLAAQILEDALASIQDT
jgi:hypothetical protein